MLCTFLVLARAELVLRKVREGMYFFLTETDAVYYDAFKVMFASAKRTFVEAEKVIISSLFVTALGIFYVFATLLP